MQAHQSLDMHFSQTATAGTNSWQEVGELQSRDELTMQELQPLWLMPANTMYVCFTTDMHTAAACLPV